MATRPPAIDVAPAHIVATLFYRVDKPHQGLLADQVPHTPQDTIPAASLETLRDGASPTKNMEAYPLEPPTQGPDALDNLYGNYISQSCLNDFTTTLTSILPDLQPGTVNARKLERSSHCRVVEITFPLPRASTVSLETLRRHDSVSRFEREWNVECVFQADSIHRLSLIHI